MSLKYRESSSHSKDIFRKGEWAKVSRAPFFPPGVLPGKLGEFFSSRVCLRNTCLFVLWGARMTVQSAQIPAQRATDPPIWCKMSSANQLKAKFVAEKETSVVNRWEKAVRTRDRVSVRSEVKKDSSTGFERSSVRCEVKKDTSVDVERGFVPSEVKKDERQREFLTDLSKRIFSNRKRSLSASRSLSGQGTSSQTHPLQRGRSFHSRFRVHKTFNTSKTRGGGKGRSDVFLTPKMYVRQNALRFQEIQHHQVLPGAPAVANNPNLEKALRPVTNEEYDSNSLKRSKFSVCQKQNSFTV